MHAAIQRYNKDLKKWTTRLKRSKKLKSPLKAEMVNGKITLTSGKIRLQAARLAGITQIPVKIGYADPIIVGPMEVLM